MGKIDVKKMDRLMKEIKEREKQLLKMRRELIKLKDELEEKKRRGEISEEDYIRIMKLLVG